VDHARNDAVEIDLAAKGFRHLLATHGEQRRTEPDQQDDNEQNYEDGACAHGVPA
jgi:hypothetical protein